MKYKAILFSPDGDFVTDYHADSVSDVWKQASDGGSRWYFYPFAFVIRDDSPAKTMNQRIVDVPDFPYFTGMKGNSVRQVSEFIKENGQELCDYLNQ